MLILLLLLLLIVVAATAAIDQTVRLLLLLLLLIVVDAAIGLIIGVLIIGVFCHCFEGKGGCAKFGNDDDEIGIDGRSAAGEGASEVADW